jgi:YD repeat-containing protein
MGPGAGGLVAAGAELLPRYSTKYADTYRLANGHMLTQIFMAPRSRSRLPASDPRPAGALSSLAPLLAEGGSGGEDELACTVDSAAPTTSECNPATLRAGAEPFVKPARSVHGLLQFGLPNLHSNVKVLNAQLELYETASTTTEAVNMSAFRVLTPWRAGVTWRTTDGSTPWKTPGGDYTTGNNIDSAPAQVGTAKGWHYWYPTAIVQKWLNGTSAPRGEGQPNLGLLLADELEGERSNVVSFAGRGQTHAPALTFEWVLRGIGTSARYTMLPVSTGTATTLNVNAASGDLVAQSTDLNIPSRGTPFQVARTSNSLDPEAFGYGRGWVDANTPHIEVGPNGAVRFISATDNSYVFDRSGLVAGKPAGYRTPPELENGPEEAVLCAAGASNAPVCPKTLPKSATYEIWFLKQELQLFFKGQTGTIYPLAIEYPGKELETPHYTTGLALPTSWTDTAALPITYTETKANGYSKAAFEAQGETVEYAETTDSKGAPRLVKYTSEQRKLTTYAYGSGSEEGLLTKITEPDGTVINIAYDPQGRVARVETVPAGQTSGSTTSYTYFELGKAPGPCTSAQKATVVTETEGNEEPAITYCANVLDEVENVGYPATGQPGSYVLEDEADSESARASVNLASGNLLVKSEDIVPEAANHGMSLDRYYNLQATQASGTLGPRWSWGTGPSVYLLDEGAKVILHGPNGYVVTLTRAPDGTYTGPTEYEGTLTKNPDGSYTLTNEDAPTYQFNASGTLARETTEEGNTFTIADTTLSGKSVLHALSPSSGKALELTYDSTPHVTQTSDPASHVRHYEYDSSHRLKIYTDAAGGKTEYEYDAANDLSKITMPDGTVQKITNSNGKVIEVTTTQNGETVGAKFAYQTPTGPACNPVTDAVESVVTSIPSGSSETSCYNAAGSFTGPTSQAEAETEPIGAEEQPEIPAGTCYENPEFPKEDCGQGEPPPENSEGGLLAAAAKGNPDLPAGSYGIADNNWLQLRKPTKKEEENGVETKAHFNYFESPFVQALHVKLFRRTIPWNMVIEAENDEATPEFNGGAKRQLEDVEEWITQVKEQGGKTGQPLISFERCPAGTLWEDPTVKEDSLDDKSCEEAPSVAAYKIGMERFLNNPKHPILGQVKYFTPWNEPNNGAQPVAKNGLRAGEYWRALAGLCQPKAQCYVAAGDFLDKEMPDANNVTSAGGKYLAAYLNGMGHPLSAGRWAWHAYSDGVATQSKGLKGRARHWWTRFRNFLGAVNKSSARAPHPHPDIWLSEQGVVFAQGNESKEPFRKSGAAENIMNAYVNHGLTQLTRKSLQIQRFYYYSTRGAPDFDSGLLEAEFLPPGQARRHPPSQPRTIYNIYKSKTPPK